LRRTDLRCEGSNLFLADGTAAGQEIPTSKVRAAR
jgi:hypothetical protein